MSVGRITFICLFIIVVLFGQCYAGGYGRIEGTVFDKELNIPIGGANIVFSDMGTRTFSDGSFRARKIPPGTCTIEVLILGYETQEISNVLITSDSTTELHFNLVYNDTVPLYECPHGKSDFCEVHGLELNPTVLVLRYPLMADSENLDPSDADIYDRAHKKHFPHADVECNPDIITRGIKSGSWRTVILFRCSECIVAHDKWLEEHERIKDTIRNRTKFH